MDNAIVTAMAGVLGSLAGGSATVATAWITQKTVSRRELTQLEMRKRETLYGEFIAECAKLLMDAFTHTLDTPEKLLLLYALLNRIRLCASLPVLAAAEQPADANHRPIFLAKPYARRNTRSGAFGTRRSAENVRRGVPDRAQVDARRGVVG
jgi:hypothetical protein